jgi:hypothetical protein
MVIDSKKFLTALQKVSVGIEKDSDKDIIFFKDNLLFTNNRDIAISCYTEFNFDKSFGVKGSSLIAYL